MADLARTLLAPILLAQGRRMFRTMPRLGEPHGDRDGTVGSGSPLRLLLTGDSSAAGVGVGTQGEALLGQVTGRIAQTHQVTYSLWARHGSTIPGTLRFVRKQDPEAVDAAVVVVGLNDVLAGRALGPWMDGYRELVGTLQTRFEARHVVVSGLPPIGAFPALPQPLRWVIGRQARRHDTALHAWADAEAGVSYVSVLPQSGEPLADVPVPEVMSRDGFHPGPRVYAEWGRRIAATLAASGIGAASETGPAPETHAPEAGDG
ncbi:MAG: SGNH/GDSL hydrolase family protein [Bacteroidota bacterium]